MHGDYSLAALRDPWAAQRAMEQHLFVSARHAVAALERLDFFEETPPEYQNGIHERAT